MDREQMIDEELVEMISEGDEVALGALYDRYSRPAYSLALRIVRDRELAEEVVQDAFVTVWRKAGTYRPESGRLYSWFLTVVRNRAIDELRRPQNARNSRRVELREVMVEGHETETTDRRMQEAEWISEVREAVRGAMSGLPEEQREVIEMSYMRGLSQREIAVRTGIPLGTVKTRSRLALEKLRRSLDPAMSRSLDLDGM